MVRQRAQDAHQIDAALTRNHAFGARLIQQRLQIGQTLARRGAKLHIAEIFARQCAQRLGRIAGAGSAIGYALVNAGVASFAIRDFDAERTGALVSRLAGLGRDAV